MVLGRIFYSRILSNLRYNLGNDIQFYSVFPPNYIKPIYKKDEQELMYSNAKIKQLIHAPIKPASGFETCSEFHDIVIRKFTNHLMRKGKRQLARKLIEETFENIKIIKLNEYYNTSPEYRENIILDPKTLLHHAVKNCTPILELKKIKRGGIYYQVPIPMNDSRAQFLSINWLIKTAQEKGNIEKFSNVLAREIIDAAKNQGRVVKKKQELHKLCEANRAYAHYRWL